MLKKPRELFHCNPGLSDQRPKGSFGKFLMVGNGEASVRWKGASQNDMAPVLLIEFVSDLSALAASLPEITGSFIRRRAQ